MPVLYRTILVLRDLEGFSSAEVAAIVGRREATVRWRLAKAASCFESTGNAGKGRVEEKRRISRLRDG